MRDKQSPGDTYNHKEHVYADPVALRKEIERERQEEDAKRKKAAEEEAKLRAATPPPLPTGPRKGASGSIMYAELEKKTNIPSVRDLGSRFGGTVPRPVRRQSEDDQVPPPIPAVTDTRNILDSDSPPVSPNEVTRNEGLPSDSSPLSVPDNDMNISTEDTHKQQAISNDGNANISIPEDEALTPNITEDEITQQPESSSNVCENKSEVVIDVKINSEFGFDIGADIPELRENETSDENCGIKLVKNIPLDAFYEESGETVQSSEKPVPVPDASSAASKAEQSSVAGSAVSSTNSSKTRKKKDVESGIGSASHQRRNLIIVSLFLLILLILISAVVIFLLGQSWSQN
ncbi:uncharacterized protein [Asterias amurensis]|uniref:uncharacterized protein n=1 Tax=Asterias amurensis TaxID=7602 RepID=UPI003AB37FBA